MVRAIEREHEFRPLSKNCPLYQMYLHRIRSKRDLRIIVTAENSETGTGKTTLSLYLALSFDNGWNPMEKAALDIPTYARRYRELSPGSVLLFDECHQVDNRKSMSNVNIMLSRLWMTMRVRQICTIFTTPTLTVIDKRLKELADVRVHVIRRGLAMVYRIKVNHFDGSIWEEPIHAFNFPNLDWHPYKKILDDMKDELIEGIITQIEEPEEKMDDLDIKRESLGKLYPLKEAARILGVHPMTIKRWEAKGKIKCIKTIGNTRRVPESEIKRILSKQIATIEV